MTWLSSATLHEAAGQIGALPAAIKPVARGMKVRGPAFTVYCSPRDNLPLHHAIASAPPGSVLVCHTSGWYEAGYFGGLMATASVARGIAGLVIDGCVRDVAELAAGSLPVFARGTSIVGTTKDPRLAGGVGTRIRIGGVDIDPGSLVVGDDDGVVVLPASLAETVPSKGEEREANEAAARQRLEAGESNIQVFRLPPLG